MKHALRALALFLALQPVLAVAQSKVPLPYHTLWGRIGAQPGDTGPGQAIPFASVLPSLVGAQTANTIYAGPSSGGAAQPTFRAQVGADLPNPGASSKGGVQSLTCSASNWFSTLSTGGVFGCSQPNFTDLAGSIAAGQIPAAVVALTKLATQNNNTVVGNVSGGAASPIALTQTQLTALINAATASLSGALPAFPNNTTTYFRGDGTYVTHNCAALTDSSVGCNAARGQLPGETSTGSASAGNVGEYTESVINSGSATGLVTATAKTVTSISLTAGDWDVDAVGYFLPTGTTSLTYINASIGTVTNVQDATPGRFNTLAMAAFVPGVNAVAMPVPNYRISVSGPTTIFLVVQSVFTVSTLGGYGIVRARRVR